MLLVKTRARYVCKLCDTQEGVLEGDIGLERLMTLMINVRFSASMYRGICVRKMRVRRAIRALR